MKTTSLLCSFLLLAACSTESQEGQGGSDSTTSSTGTEEQPLACKAPTHGPTHHATNIEADEVWTADTGPHIVDANVAVRSGATLTIDPCATVELGEDVVLSVAFPGTPNSGVLVAEGKADQPIRFQGIDEKRWGHLQIEAPGTARLAYVTLENGGSWDPSGASLVVHGDDTYPTQRLVTADHLTIERSLGAGVSMTRLAGFADGSKALVVTGSGNDDHPYPLEIDESVLGTLPDATLTGNARDAIFVDPLHSIRESATVRALGVPYVIGNADSDNLVVGAGPDAGVHTTLTVEPGVTMAFHPHTALEIEHLTGDFPASGSLVALGTAAEPIVFTSSADEKNPGDWRGLWFGGVVADDTRIEHAQIEYTGADCGCVLTSCNDVSTFAGAVIITREPSSTFVSDSVISHGSANAFVMGYMGQGFDFAGQNTIEETAGCKTVIPSAPSCPSPKPACE